MCNDYRSEVGIASIMVDFDDLKIKVVAPEGTPNVQPREDIWIGDMVPIVRTAATPGSAELVNRKWSWMGQSGGMNGGKLL